MVNWLKRREGVWLFVHSPAAIVAAIVALAIIFGAVFATWIAQVDPYDLSSFSLFDGLLPPVWEDGAKPRYLLGTDEQGRDMISSILYGARLSLVIGISALTIAPVLGVGLGLAAGFYGGRFDAVVMRIADVQLALPAILTALLIDGIARGVLPASVQADVRVAVLMLAIAPSLWANFARTARASTFVQMQRDTCRRRHNGPAARADHVCAHPAQYPWAVAGDHDRRSGERHFAGGHVVVSGHRPACGQPQPWHADPHRNSVFAVGGMVDSLDSHAVSGRLSGVDQHPWRLPAGCF